MCEITLSLQCPHQMEASVFPSAWHWIEVYICVTPEGLKRVRKTHRKMTFSGEVGMQVETRGKGTHYSAPIFPKGSTTGQMCETIKSGNSPFWTGIKIKVLRDAGWKQHC